MENKTKGSQEPSSSANHTQDEGSEPEGQPPARKRARARKAQAVADEMLELQNLETTTPKKEKRPQKKKAQTAQGMTFIESVPSEDLSLEGSPVREEDSESFLDALKSEWKMFWHGLVGDDEPAAEQYQKLSESQYKQLMQMLSQDRRNLNLHIEKINREIETQADIVQRLQLVGSDPAEALEKINKLNDVGMNLSLELAKIDAKIQELRQQNTAPQKPAENTEK
jgi:flagellar motor switch/type III secretory pathway protein FliN